MKEFKITGRSDTFTKDKYKKIDEKNMEGFKRGR